MSLRRRKQAEWEWALATLRDLAIPPVAHIEDLVAFFEQHLGYSITVEATDDVIINGALEARPGGNIAVRIPSGAGSHRRHFVCRGLARCLYRQPGDRTGNLDYSSAIEREIESAATLLSLHLTESARLDPLAVEFGLSRPLTLAQKTRAAPGRRWWPFK
ncbi:MAG TPA: hypothetical protein DD420_34985 [Streptomyces sp.]|nr:hypothetical protein [Streptomyces sp.]